MPIMIFLFSILTIIIFVLIRRRFKQRIANGETVFLMIFRVILIIIAFMLLRRFLLEHIEDIFFWL